MNEACQCLAFVREWFASFSKQFSILVSHAYIAEVSFGCSDADEHLKNNTICIALG